TNQKTADDSADHHRCRSVRAKMKRMGEHAMSKNKKAGNSSVKQKQELLKTPWGLNISSSVLKFLIYVALLVILVFTVKEAYSIGYRIFDQKAAEKSPGRDVEITITEGMSVSEIGKMLEEKKVINSQLTFRLQEWFTGYHGKIKPGTYTVNTSFSPETILAILSADSEYLEKHQIGLPNQN
ncbi:MAG: endolytic transglycosylase MltG, partial [Lachnospiraceae bacterium]|nr:endolytic transglycosylase MltG [Lachnospiraceae bacterium]